MNSNKKLPRLKKDRIIDTIYLYNGKKVIWDGNRLRCEHNIATSSHCPICCEEETKEIEIQDPLCGEKYPKLPESIIRRKQETIYNFNGVKILWAGREMLCDHRIPKHSVCKYCKQIANKAIYFHNVEYFRYLHDQRTRR